MLYLVGDTEELMLISCLQPAVGLVPIRTALSRMDPSLATFTSVHLLYLRLCHEVRAFYEALPILDQFIRSFPSQSIAGAEFTLPCADHFTSAGYITVRSGLSDRITAADVHEYFLLGANTYLALRQYKQAQLLLEYILTTPTQNVASGLMAEAYRKWVLVGCLVDGAVSIWPPKARRIEIDLRSAAAVSESQAVQQPRD